MQLQLNKICELEDAFVKGFSKDKWKEYFNLDKEKGQLHNLEIDHVIEVTHKVCKKFFYLLDDFFALFFASFISSLSLSIDNDKLSFTLPT